MQIKKGLYAGLLVLLIIAVSSPAMARGFGKGQHPGWCGEAGLKGLRTYIDLNLSDSQKEEMKKIFGKHDAYKEENRLKMQKAHQDLRQALQAEPFNEQTAREVFQKLSALRENMLISRHTLQSEIKAVLTPEQAKIFQQQRIQKRQRMQPALEEEGLIPAE